MNKRRKAFLISSPTSTTSGTSSSHTVDATKNTGLVSEYSSNSEGTQPETLYQAEGTPLDLHSVRRALANPSKASPATLLQMHSLYGNRAVQRLLVPKHRQPEATTRFDQSSSHSKTSLTTNNSSTPTSPGFGVARMMGEPAEPPVLEENESGDIPYNQHPKWGQMLAAIRDKGFDVRMVYNGERKQHTVVRRNTAMKKQTLPENVPEYEKYLAVGSKTTYTDIEHEYTHILQQDRYNEKGGAYLTSEVIVHDTEKDTKRENKNGATLNNWKDEIGEVEAYAKEFIRLFDRKEFVTSGQKLSSLVEQLNQYLPTYNEKANGRSASDKKWINDYYPGLSATIATYKQKLELYKQTEAGKGEAKNLASSSNLGMKALGGNLQAMSQPSQQLQETVKKEKEKEEESGSSSSSVTTTTDIQEKSKKGEEDN
jgi:hypothetical protein